MKAGLLLLGLIASLSSLALFWAQPTDGGLQQPGLPGARPVVDAARFPSLQAAIDAIPDTGGGIQLPPGTFKISEPLLIQTSDVLLQGSGTATHIKNTNTNGQPAIRIQHPDGAKVKRGDQRWRIMLSNLRITGNDQSGHGIEAIQINELFLQGVTVSDHGGDGIRLDHCYEDPRISDCLITYNKGTGLNLLGCHDIVVSANQFEENQDALRCIDSFNLCMTGNCVDDHLGAGVVIENTYGSVVSGNMIEECHDAAIVLDRDCYGDTMSANVIAHNGAGIDLRDAHGCTVSANTFTIMQSDAVRIGPNSGRITVTGNNFSDSHIGNDQLRRKTDDRAAAGMTLAGTSDVVISGNSFSSLRPKAVEVGPSPNKRILFANNILTDTTSDQDRFQDSAVQNNLE